MKPHPQPAPPAIHLPVLAELIPRGDGTFILKPCVPEPDLDTWITIRQAGEVIGHVGRKAVYRLLDEYLVYRRPLRSKILVSLKSARALRQATQDPQFWYNPRLQQPLRDQVRAAMHYLATGASPPPPKPTRAPASRGSVPGPNGWRHAPVPPRSAA